MVAVIVISASLRTRFLVMMVVLPILGVIMTVVAHSFRAGKQSPVTACIEVR